MPSNPLQSINHYNDSVWKLVSKDEDLKTFWVGTKNGIYSSFDGLGQLWKTWIGASCTSQSVCMGQESSGITALDGIEGEMVWTGSFDLSSWIDISSKKFPITFDGSNQELNIPRGSVAMDCDYASDIAVLSPKTNKLPIYETPNMRIKGITDI